jgi:dipeptidyl aminopeptidase/acylaminoacyl peptidase
MHSKSHRLSPWLFLLLLLPLLTACGRSALPQTGSSLAGALAAPTRQAASPTPLPSATSTSLPSTTPTVTPSPTVTPTPTPTLHPMSIQALRQGDYPGSQIVIEDTLERGANYSRYHASYLSEGLKIYTLLTVPDGEPPPGGFPAIVFNHGYIPPREYRTTERYIAYVDWLARSGYIVFRIDYRGHDRSEGAASGAYGSPGYTVDVLNAVSSIKQFPQANPERIGMWGHSMGGYLTLRSMVVSPDIKAGVIWAGVVASYPDLLTRWRRTGGSAPTPPPGGTRGWRASWAELYGSPDENPEFWRSVSSNSYLADISGPVQLHHGTADESVPLEFSQILYDELQATGKEVEFYTYDGDNHNISNSFSAAMTRTIEFFNQYLKDAP